MSPAPRPLLLPPGLQAGEAFIRIMEYHGARLRAEAARIGPGDIGPDGIGPDGIGPDGIGPDGIGPEAVHQARVALRRMRSALAVFRPATDGEATRALATSLRGLGHLLGPARAWDVFLTGAGARIGDAFAGHRGIAGLLRAARRRQQAAYAALAQELAGAHFAGLHEQLARIVDERSWIAALGPEQRANLLTPLDRFGAAVLERLHARTRRAGRRFRQLDTAQLHALRLRAKRLRYAGEFFAEQFPGKPTRRYLRRLAAVQEELGWLNDAATTDALVAELGARGPAAEQAGGIVLGYVAAEAGAARARLPGTWKRFRRAEPFWTAGLVPAEAAEPAAT